jgi:hypothetical protein
MCTGGKREASPPQRAVRLHTIDPSQADTARTQAQARQSQSRKGERPPSSRKPERPESSSHGHRKSSGSSHDSHSKRRPSTSGPTPRKDGHSGPSARPRSAREQTSYRQSESRRRQFDPIPENRPVQYTEDQAIINRVAELYTLIDQHAANFYSLDSVWNGISESELNDPETRLVIIRRSIAQGIIDQVISSQSEMYVIEVHEAFHTFQAQADRLRAQTQNYGA